MIHPKKFLPVLLAAALLALTVAAAPANENRENWQVIKRAVRDDAPRAIGREARFLKILITSGRSHREKLRLTLPLSLVEAVVRMASDKHGHFDCEDLDLDFREVLAELRKGGPQALLEIKEHGETIKIWLE